MLMADAQIDKILVPQCQRASRPATPSNLDRDQGRRHLSEGTLPDPSVDEPPRRRHFEKLAADRDPTHRPRCGSFRSGSCRRGADRSRSPRQSSPAGTTIRAAPTARSRRGKRDRARRGNGVAARSPVRRRSCSGWPAFDGGSHALSSLSRYSPSASSWRSQNARCCSIQAAASASGVATSRQ